MLNEDRIPHRSVATLDVIRRHDPELVRRMASDLRCVAQDEYDEPKAKLLNEVAALLEELVA